MKPTQEQILSALNKLIRENKTELKTEKVELGVAQDIDKRNKELKKAIKSATALIKDAESDIKEVRSSIKSLEVVFNKLNKLDDTLNKEMNKASKLQDLAEKQAKELGVVVSDIPKFNEFLKARQEANNTSFSIEDIQKEIKKYSDA